MKMNEKDKALEALRLLAAQCGNAKVRSENLKIVKDYVEERHEQEGGKRIARLKNSYLADIKTRVSILDVVTPHVQLKRAGKSWKGLSPFSQEKTPSFYVHPERNSFKCFSTDIGGDAIRFVELVENLTFMEAVETLARKFNFPVQYEQGFDYVDERHEREAALLRNAEAEDMEEEMQNEK